MVHEFRARRPFLPLCDEATDFLRALSTDGKSATNGASAATLAGSPAKLLKSGATIGRDDVTLVTRTVSLPCDP